MFLGYGGDVCLDINECVENPDPALCGDHGTCVNNDGSYICDCDAGTVASMDSWFTLMGSC